MTSLELLGFLALAAAGAYVQTITGFAFGLITIGGVALLGLMPLTDAAAVISALSLVNCLQMLTQGWRHIARRELALVLVSSLPLVIVGFVMLNWLAAGQADALRLTLGAIIIASSLQLARPQRAEPKMPGAGSYLFFGAVAGWMGGMFSASGPPLVYQFYRTPMPIVTIRETLVTVYAANSLLRLGLVAVSDAKPPASVWLGLAAIPVVMAATAAARRWPPPIAQRTLRLSVFGLLFLAGVSLGAPALLRMAS